MCYAKKRFLRRLSALLICGVYLLAAPAETLAYDIETDSLLVSIVPAEESLPVSDVSESDWYFEALYWCCEKGLLQDIPLNGRFQGDAAVTRAFFLSALARLIEPELMWTDETVFSDVQPGSFYFAPVSWAGANGLASGYSDGSAHPGDLLTRQQGAAFLGKAARYLGFDTTPTDSSRFLACSDAQAVDAWARKDVKWCLQTGILAGTSSGALEPQGKLTRAQTVQILYRFGQWLSKSTPETSPIPALAVTENTPLHAETQAKIDKIAAKYGAAGLAVAYVKDGRVVDTYSYGTAQRGIRPMTSNTKIRIASISKVLVGIAAHIAAQDGQFDLDADIGQYLGVDIRTRRTGDIVTPRSILTHTSSLVVAGEGTPCDIRSVRSRLASASAVKNVVSGNPSNWAYNNYAFGVLGLGVECAEKRTLDEILYEHVYGPLHIDAAFYTGDLENTDMLAEIYRANGAVGLSYRYQAGNVSDGLPGTNGATFAGGAAISAYDLGKIVAMLANDGVYDGVSCLDPAVVSALEQHLDQMVSGGFYQGTPLRYRTWAYGQSELYYHTGSAYGVYNLISYNPNTKAGVVVLTSGASAAKDRYGIYAVCGEISELLYGA